MITDHAEGTFASLRYFLGGDHPSQTTHHTLFPVFAGLGPKYIGRVVFQGRLHRTLACPLRSLPPILHIMYSSPM